ncbi:hypothetical protein CISIN_1g0085681mg, partial [Citrus sinensis]
VIKLLSAVGSLGA